MKITLEVTAEELCAMRWLANSPVINGVAIVKLDRVYALGRMLDRNAWTSGRVLKLERAK
jgi:hypothetical protein